MLQGGDGGGQPIHDDEWPQFPPDEPPRGRRWRRLLAETTSRTVAVVAGALVILVGAFALNTANDSGGEDEAPGSPPSQISPSATESGVPPKPSPSASPSTRSPSRKPGSSGPKAPEPTPSDDGANDKPTKNADPLGPAGPSSGLASAESGKCAEAGSDPSSPQAIRQRDCDGAVGQQWSLRESDDGLYQLRNPHTDGCLTFRDGKAATAACSDTAADQRWRFTVNAHNNGWTYGYLRNEGDGYCLDLYESDHSDQAVLGPFSCVKDTRNQMFRVLPSAL
nr:RICIN domain-containing protein [Streptomyces coryli]